MALDLSQLSDSDLKALSKKDYANMSDAGLKLLAGSGTTPKGSVLGGVGETALAMGTGLVGTVVGGWQGIGGMVSDKLSGKADTWEDAYKKNIGAAQQTRESLSYAPKTETGQNIAQTTSDVLGYVPHKVGEATQWGAQQLGAGDFASAVAGGTGEALSGMLLPSAVAKGAKVAKPIVAPVVNKVTEAVQPTIQGAKTVATAPYTIPKEYVAGALKTSGQESLGKIPQQVPTREGQQAFMRGEIDVPTLESQYMVPKTEALNTPFARAAETITGGKISPEGQLIRGQGQRLREEVLNPNKNPFQIAADIGGVYTTGVPWGTVGKNAVIGAADRYLGKKLYEPGFQEQFTAAKQLTPTTPTVAGGTADATTSGFAQELKDIGSVYGGVKNQLQGIGAKNEQINQATINTRAKEIMDVYKAQGTIIDKKTATQLATDEVTKHTKGLEAEANAKRNAEIQAQREAEAARVKAEQEAFAQSPEGIAQAQHAKTVENAMAADPEFAKIMNSRAGMGITYKDKAIQDPAYFQQELAKHQETVARKKAYQEQLAAKEEAERAKNGGMTDAEMYFNKMAPVEPTPVLAPQAPVEPVAPKQQVTPQPNPNILAPVRPVKQTPEEILATIRARSNKPIPTKTQEGPVAPAKPVKTETPKVEEFNPEDYFAEGPVNPLTQAEEAAQTQALKDAIALKRSKAEQSGDWTQNVKSRRKSGMGALEDLNTDIFSPNYDPLSAMREQLKKSQEIFGKKEAERRAAMTEKERQLEDAQQLLNEHKWETSRENRSNAQKLRKQNEKQIYDTINYSMSSKNNVVTLINKNHLDELAAANGNTIDWASQPQLQNRKLVPLKEQKAEMRKWLYTQIKQGKGNEAAKANPVHANPIDQFFKD